MEGVALETTEWYDVGLWKAIKRGWGAFKSKISFVMGNGRRVRFWKDIWFKNTPFLEPLSHLCLL